MRLKAFLIGLMVCLLIFNGTTSAFASIPNDKAQTKIMVRALGEKMGIMWTEKSLNATVDYLHTKAYIEERDNHTNKQKAQMLGDWYNYIKNTSFVDGTATVLMGPEKWYDGMRAIYEAVTDINTSTEPIANFGTTCDVPEANMPPNYLTNYKNSYPYWYIVKSNTDNLYWFLMSEQPAKWVNGDPDPNYLYARELSIPHWKSTTSGNNKYTNIDGGFAAYTSSSFYQASVIMGGDIPRECSYIPVQEQKTDTTKIPQYVINNIINTNNTNTNYNPVNVTITTNNDYSTTNNSTITNNEIAPNTITCPEGYLYDTETGTCVEEGIDINPEPEKDSDGDGIPDSEDDTPFGANTIRNNIEQFFKMSVDGMDALVKGTDGLRDFFKEFFSWLPKEFVWMLTTGFGIGFIAFFFRR